MAIQAKIQTIQGITLETAYINLANPQISKVKTEVITPIEDSIAVTTTIVNSYNIGANACIYSNKEYYDAKILAKETPIPVEGFSVTCALDLSKNVLEQVYTELKLNPRLEDIVDLDTITLAKEV